MSTHNIPFLNIKKKLILNYHKSATMFHGTQERVRNSRGKRAISVRATEVLLYFVIVLTHFRYSVKFTLTKVAFIVCTEKKSYHGS